MSSQNTNNNNFEFDVLIIGAGLVGTSLACMLEPIIQRQNNHSLKVALVETFDLNEPRERPPSFDARASALSYGTRKTYGQMGLWASLESLSTPILEVHVSDKNHFGMTRLHHQDQQLPALGYVIPNYLLGELLLEQVKKLWKEQQISVFSPEKVEGISPVDGGMSVKLSSFTTRAKLVVLADGGRSGIMDQLVIQRSTINYEQHALIANLELDRPHNGIAYERFSEAGPVALLPLSENHSALVWTLANSDIDRIKSLRDTDFLELVQKQFGYRAGIFKKMGKRHSYPLTMTQAKEQVRPGLVILGNAAHTLHPVAGQGYNLAIRDLEVLVQVIADAVDNGDSPGKLAVLLDYEKQRIPDQRRVSLFCDGLVKLFTRNDNASVFARNLGLAALDLTTPAKVRFTRKAMGL